MPAYSVSRTARYGSPSQRVRTVPGGEFRGGGAVPGVGEGARGGGGPHQLLTAAVPGLGHGVRSPQRHGSQLGVGEVVASSMLRLQGSSAAAFTSATAALVGAPTGPLYKGAAISHATLSPSRQQSPTNDRPTSPRQQRQRWQQHEPTNIRPTSPSQQQQQQQWQLHEPGNIRPTSPTPSQQQQQWQQQQPANIRPTSPSQQQQRWQQHEPGNIRPTSPSHQQQQWQQQPTNINTATSSGLGLTVGGGGRRLDLGSRVGVDLVPGSGSRVDVELGSGSRTGGRGGRVGEAVASRGGGAGPAGAAPSPRREGGARLRALRADLAATASQIQDLAEARRLAAAAARV